VIIFYSTVGTKAGRICNGLNESRAISTLQWRIVPAISTPVTRNLPTDSLHDLWLMCNFYAKFGTKNAYVGTTQSIHENRASTWTPDASPTHRRTRRLNRRNPPASTHTPDASAHQSANESVSPHCTRYYWPPLAQKTQKAGAEWPQARSFLFGIHHHDSLFYYFYQLLHTKNFGLPLDSWIKMNGCVT